MNLSPRLTRAALAFLLFGTAALLPAQDTTALAENGCLTGPAGSSGQLAIAPAANNVQDFYTLVPAVTTYHIYFKPDAASAYATVNASESTTAFVLNSGQVYVTKATYSTANPPSTTAASFTAAQATVYTAGKPSNVAGSMTATSSYSTTDSQGNMTAYKASAVFSTNP